MKHRLLKLFIGLLATASFITTVQANSSEETLSVEKVWATPTFPMAMMGAAYFTAVNESESLVEITGLSVDASIAKMAELHESYMEGEMAKMRELPMPYKIAPAQKLQFQPGGKHIMLMGLTGPLEEGRSFNLTLHFANGTTQEISVPVLQTSDAEDSGHHHNHH